MLGAGTFFLVIGDLTAVLVLVVMLMTGETTKNPEPIRTALGTVHGLLALAGLNYAILTITGVSRGWGIVLGLADPVAVGLVALVLALGFPERAPGESTWPLWRTTLAPFAYTIVWAIAGALTFHSGWESLGEAALASLAFLGVHYTLLTGAVFITLLLDPPSVVPAAEMTLRERVFGVFGLLVELFIAALFVQGGMAMVTHHERLFGHGAWGPIVSFALWGLGLVQAVRETWHVFARD